MILFFFALLANVAIGHVLVFGSHRRFGQVAAKRAVFHGFNVTGITPQNRRLFFDTKEACDKDWLVIFIDGSTVTPNGIEYVKTRFPDMDPVILTNVDDCVREVDRMFGLLI